MLETELGSESVPLGPELGLALGWALKGELGRDLKEALKDLKVATGGSKGDLTRNQEQAAWEDRSGRPLGWMLGWMLGWVRKQERAQQRAQQKQWHQELQQTQARRREQARQREQEQQREQWLRSQQRGQWRGQRLRERLQQLRMEWENISERQLALELARRVLGEVLEQLLSGELEPNWPKKRADPKALAKAIPDKPVCVCVGWMIENLGKIMIRKVEEAPFLSSSFPGLLEFPASFLVSSKVNSDAPRMRLEKYEDLETFMKGIIERHVDSVASL